MARLRLTVCLPAEAADDIEGALDEALAPFYLDTSDNPVDRQLWDWRTITGGCDGSGFAVASGHENDPGLLHDASWDDGTPCPNAPGICAGGPRALLDFSRPLAASERAVAESWDLWHRLSAVHPPALPLADFLDRWWNDPTAYPDDRWGDGMFADYRSQPLIHAYLGHPHSLGMESLGFPNPSEHPVIDYDGDRDAYIREFTRSSPPDTNVLTLDGWWVETDGNALHATCDPDLCPHEGPLPGAWPGSEPYLASLPGDTILVRLRCHA
ncbi:hypothetical protein [Streptomyces sp. NBC_01264]|uniref:hypothetical protein n=1 Tax=Streptomyces sp. NBC_01264 TaxID=2903804 RepID=UPI00225C21CC|nr:hypothetical protein [Streptomyces sp. NBC_01264]MCX4779979.1 hypothetical protein [Streptomyces sp. NBC_01264]